ncbi:MAG: hypothetical protein KJ749_14200, partial [Planctomycetes bacterium]|nr:hypothetical protein [Planctomycetota bacterium]
MRAAVGYVLWFGGFLLGSAGCATTPAMVASAPNLVAVRYDVELETLTGLYDAEAMKRDFARIAELGFNTIAFYHVDDRERHTVVSGAEDAGLRVLVQPPNFRRYVSAGVLPRGCPDVQSLVDAGIARSPGGPGSWTPLVDSSGVGRAGERGRRLASALVSRGHPFVMVGGPDGSDGHQSLAVVDLGVGVDESDGAPLERWLAAYHRGLLQGKTGGVLFDRYRFPGGGSAGLGPRDASLDAAQAAALGDLLWRVRVWGRRLHQFAAVRCEAAIPS